MEDEAARSRGDWLQGKDPIPIWLSHVIMAPFGGASKCQNHSIWMGE
jgi:hypothetical protein